MSSQINLAEALHGQARSIVQGLRNPGVGPIQGPGVGGFRYDWPDRTTVIYHIDDDQTITFEGIHVSDFGPISWSDEEPGPRRLVKEITVPEGVPFSDTFKRTSSETQTLEEATRIGLETAVRAGLGQEYGTGISLNAKVSRETEQRFGKSATETLSSEFSIGPVTEPGTYRIESFPFTRRVTSRPKFDFHIVWQRHTYADGGYHWWERVEFECKQQLIDLLRGMAPDSIGVYRSGRIVSGDYASESENAPKPLAPMYRERPQDYYVNNPVAPLTFEAAYGQATVVTRV